MAESSNIAIFADDWHRLRKDRIERARLAGLLATCTPMEVLSHQAVRAVAMEWPHSISFAWLNVFLADDASIHETVRYLRQEVGPRLPIVVETAEFDGANEAAPENMLLADLSSALSCFVIRKGYSDQLFEAIQFLRDRG